MADSGEGPVRPWGRYEILVDDEDHKVKRIYVAAGKRLSLQRHHRRDERWVIIRGSGLATVGQEQISVGPGDSVRIMRSEAHRIECTGEEELLFVEVQTGEYFGEDDIERLEDDFGRE